MIKTESKLLRGSVLYMNMVTNTLFSDPRIYAFSANDVVESGQHWTIFEIYWKEEVDES